MRKRVLWAAVAAVGVCATFAANAVDAAPSVSVRMFADAAVQGPEGIALGPDGAMWFTNAVGHSIGRISLTGALTTYTAPGVLAPSAITTGPDGALWFVNGANSIGRISVGGQITTLPVPGVGTPISIAAGPDGALWVTTANKSIGRITTSGVVTMFGDPLRMRGTTGIAAGPDGALWFTNYLGRSIGRITVDGDVSLFTDPSIRYPLSIAAGPDGALWFTDDSGSIGRITTAGAVSSFGDASTVGHPTAIAAGPDGAMWVTDRNGSIVRITVQGAISRYAAPTIQFPVGIAAGSDGALWFTNYTGNSIGRIAADEGAPALTIVRGTKVPAAVRTRSVVRVHARLHIDRGAALTLTVRDARTGRALRLQRGTRAAATTLRRNAGVLRVLLTGPRTFSVDAVLAAAGVTKGRPYRLVLSVVGSNGERSQATVAFRG